MKKLGIIIAVFIVILIVLGVFAFVLSNMNKGIVNQAPNPFASTTSGNISPSQTPLPLTLTDGSSLSVPDFTKQNQPSVAGPDTGYQAAGSSAGDYQILYFPQGSYFLISLLNEPIGATRLAAQGALESKLGLTDAQMCKLNIEVRTTIAVNDTFGGKNLGISFCPGATKLP
ncbi:MAG: hypothetical protein JWM39_500 [Parcubacteria group bacterium]|nr:hypothetical protein [Parcubacteria group bacterium]